MIQSGPGVRSVNVILITAIRLADTDPDADRRCCHPGLRVRDELMIKGAGR
jgi:hypothetical protein